MRRRPSGLQVAALVLPLLALIGLARQYLLLTPAGSWQLDLQVYREAGVSILTGRPVYAALTPPPQLLPFTYPPFAALLAVPLALLTFRLDGWLWFGAQAVVVGVVTWYAGRPAWRRLGHRGVLAWSGFTAVALWTIPIKDGFRFGQVDVFLVALVLLDLLRIGPARRLPLGVGVGLATAIKLTPGLFIVYFVVTRQWRAAATSLGTAAAATLVAAAVLPRASVTYWTGALLDSRRVGPGDATSNQSIRGVLLRLGGFVGTTGACWLLLGLAVAVTGLMIARRAHRRGQTRLAIAAVALTGLLISPVSWIHHFAWLLVVIPAIWGEQPWRDRRRLVAGLVLLVGFLLDLPWWGQHRLTLPGMPFLVSHRTDWWWSTLNNGYCLIGLIALALVGWAVRVSPPAARSAARPPADRPVGSRSPNRW